MWCWRAVSMHHYIVFFGTSSSAGMHCFGHTLKAEQEPEVAKHESNGMTAIAGYGRGLMTKRDAVTMFRWAALAEAVSYLVLLGMAMPLKYVWDMPLAVKIVGSIHGGLFVIFCAALALAMQKAAWPLTRAVMLFVASLGTKSPFVSKESQIAML